MNSPAVETTQAWQDKRWLWLLSPAIPLAFTGSLLAFAGTGQWWCMLLAPLVIHVLLPVLDRVLGEDFSNPPESAIDQLEQDAFYRALVWAYVPAQWFGTATAGGLRHHDFGGLLPAPVVCVDGPPGDGPLRRRFGPGQSASIGPSKTDAALGLNA